MPWRSARVPVHSLASCERKRERKKRVSRDVAGLWRNCNGTTWSDCLCAQHQVREERVPRRAATETEVVHRAAHAPFWSYALRKAAAPSLSSPSGARRHSCMMGDVRAADGENGAAQTLPPERPCQQPCRTRRYPLRLRARACFLRERPSRVPLVINSIIRSAHRFKGGGASPSHFFAQAPEIDRPPSRLHLSTYFLLQGLRHFTIDSGGTWAPETLPSLQSVRRLLKPQPEWVDDNADELALGAEPRHRRPRKRSGVVSTPAGATAAAGGEVLRGEGRLRHLRLWDRSRGPRSCCRRVLRAAAVRTWRLSTSCLTSRVRRCGACATYVLPRPLRPRYRSGWLGGKALRLGGASHPRRSPVGHGDGVTRRQGCCHRCRAQLSPQSIIFRCTYLDPPKM
jgi:hypothetical protein